MSLFGSNGVRGVVNGDLTAEAVLRLGKAVGRTLDGTVAVATDARDSAPAVRSAFVAGLVAVGTDVVDLGVIPTPALHLYVRDRPEIAGGVMITASHNTAEYNGLKLILGDGTEATREDERALESYCSREQGTVDAASVGTVRAEHGAAEDYVETVVSNVDADAIRRAHLTVCVDCGNGATGATTPAILDALGVDAVVLGGDPMSRARRESNPSEDNLSDLMALVPAVGADLGVAHDGDGTRAIFVDGRGRYIPGDISGALVARSVLKGAKGKVATPISSSRTLEETVEANGGLVRYTAVGSHEVIRKIAENRAVFGLDETGGMVFPDVQMCNDGGMALARMLETVVAEGPLADQVDGLPRYGAAKIVIDCPDGMKQKVMDAFSRDAEESGLHADTVDGLKIWDDDGWILLRPSTTEPRFRIYSEDRDGDTARSRAEQAAQLAKSVMEEAERRSPEALGVDRHDLVDHPRRKDGRDPGRVGGRADLVDVEAREPVADHVDGLLHVHREEPEGLRGAGPGRVGGVDPVDVQGEVDLLRLHRVERPLHGLGDPDVHDLVGADERHGVVPLELLRRDGPGAEDEHVVQPQVLRRAPHDARVAVRGAEVLVPGVQVGVYRDQGNAPLRECPDDRDVD